MDWIGLCLGVIGVGLALIPLAFEDRIPKYLHGPLLYLGIALLILAIPLGLRPIWRAANAWRQRRFGPIPVAPVYMAMRQGGIFTPGNEARGFNKAVEALVRQRQIKLFGIPGGPGGGDRPVEIPASHFDTHEIFVVPPDVAYTHKTGTPFFEIPDEPLEGRYFTLHVSRNIFSKMKQLHLQSLKSGP